MMNKNYIHCGSRITLIISSILIKLLALNWWIFLIKAKMQIRAHLLHSLMKRMEFGHCTAYIEKNGYVIAKNREWKIKSKLLTYVQKRDGGRECERKRASENGTPK